MGSGDYNSNSKNKLLIIVLAQMSHVGIRNRCSEVYEIDWWVYNFIIN